VTDGGEYCLLKVLRLSRGTVYVAAQRVLILAGMRGRGVGRGEAGAYRKDDSV